MDTSFAANLLSQMAKNFGINPDDVLKNITAIKDALTGINDKQAAILQRQDEILAKLDTFTIRGDVPEYRPINNDAVNAHLALTDKTFQEQKGS